MRLINVKTLKLETFFGNNIPPYAILSHTWGRAEDELSFQDIEAGNLNKPGRVKLEQCCKKAKEDGLQYIWIDTCCIDKASAVELDEAINSMFRWYQRSSICYAYLSDVSPGDNPSYLGSAFFVSRWFRRGWTLQELLAPEKVRFYNNVWSPIGMKDDLHGEIESITGIPPRFLLGWDDVHQASVAQRMSWAADRETTRTEDKAYCLLGIFDVIMTMIYGDGDRAMSRLQEEIMKNTRDHSILAWGFRHETPPPPTTAVEVASAGILAASPSEFADCGHLVLRSHVAVPTDTFLISGGYLQVRLRLHTTLAGVMYGLLNCGPEGIPKQVVGIPLHRTASGEYLRLQGHHAVLFPSDVSSEPAKPVPIQMARQQKKLQEATKRYWLLLEGYQKCGLKLGDIYPEVNWTKGRILVAETVNEGPLPQQRYCVRFRTQNAEDRDVVIVLDIALLGIEGIGVEHHMMLLSKDVALESLYQSFRFLKLAALRKTDATIGNVNIKAVLKQYTAKEPVIGVMLTAESGPQVDTVDATTELERFYRVHDLVKFTLEEDLASLEKDQAACAVADKVGEKGDITRALSAVEKQIKDLDKERKKLLVDLEQLDSLANDALRNHNDAIKRLSVALKNKSAMQKKVPVDDLRPDQESHDLLESIALELIHGNGRGSGSDGGGGSGSLSDSQDPDTSRGPPIPVTTSNGGQTRGGGTALSLAVASKYGNLEQLLRSTEPGKDEGEGEDEEGSEDGEVLVTIVPTGPKITSVELKRKAFNEVRSVAWSPKDGRLALPSKNGSIDIWDMDGATSLCTASGHGSPVVSVAWSCGGEMVASGSRDGTAKIWNPDTGKLIMTLQDHELGVHTVAWSPGPPFFLATRSMGSTVKIWKISTGACYRSNVGGRGVVSLVAWAAVASMLAWVNDRRVLIWDPLSSSSLNELCVQTEPIKSIVWSPRALHLVVASEYGHLSVWDSRSKGRCICSVRLKTVINSVCWSDDGIRVATANKNGTVTIWDTSDTSDMSFYQIEGKSKRPELLSIDWKRGTETIAVGSIDSEVYVLDVSEERPAAPIWQPTLQPPPLFWSKPGPGSPPGPADTPAQSKQPPPSPPSLVRLAKSGPKAGSASRGKPAQSDRLSNVSFNAETYAAVDRDTMPIVSRPKLNPGSYHVPLGRQLTRRENQEKKIQEDSKLRRFFRQL